MSRLVLGRYLMAVVVTVVSVLGCTLPCFASDVSGSLVQGDVSKVHILRQSGSYVETRLEIWVSGHANPVLVTCDASLGGSLSNCYYPSAFLGGSGCTVDRTDSIIGVGAVDETYYCRPPARRDAGACVSVTGIASPRSSVYTGFSGPEQVIWLLGTDVSYPSSGSCDSKP